MDKLIELLWKLKDPLIHERNKILDNIFKYYNPFYRRKLKKIDEGLEKINIVLYEAEQLNINLQIIEKRSK